MIIVNKVYFSDVKIYFDKMKVIQVNFSFNFVILVNSCTNETNYNQIFIEGVCN